MLATDHNPDLLSDLDGIEDIVIFKMNVTSEDDMSACAEKIEKLFGRLDVLISNAGIFDFYPVSEAGAEKLREIFDVNVFGLTNLTKYFLPLMARSSGRLIVISSESYKVPSPFQPYSVSKQALETVYKALKIELSLKGVQSILVRPGAMQTKILDDTIHFDNKNEKSLFKSEFDGFLDTVPKYIGKIVSPDKVAQTVLKAGTIRQPKAIYHINHNPVVSLLSSTPQFLKNILISKNLRKK